jgi:hypothetical protein
MPNKPTRPLSMWAAIITPKRGLPWINWMTVRGTRRAAKLAYLDGYDEEFHAHLLGGVRFARVLVTEEAGKP